MRRLIIFCVILTLLLSIPLALAQEQRTHRVQPGETLQSIAATYQVAVNDLAVANGILNPNVIRSGQVLRIPAANVPAANPQTYTVQPGDRLDWIAQRFRTTVSALVELNKLPNSNDIFVGQVLTLPAVGGPVNPASYTVQQGDTLFSIARRFNVSLTTLAALNNITNTNQIFAGQVLVIPAPGTVVTPPPVVVTPPPVVVTPVPQRTHTVIVGETLSQIAARYNVTVQSIAALNGITDNRKIFPNQILRIPPTGGPVVTPPPVVQPAGRHIVQAGETLFAISRRYNVNIYSIAQANGLLNLNAIFVGQNLVIPGR